MFKSEWDPQVGSDCPSPAPPPDQLGASFVRQGVQARFNPATVMRNTGFLNGGQPIDLGLTDITSARVAFNKCFADHKKTGNCKGFKYTHVNDDPLQKQATVTFMKGDLYPTGNNSEAAFFANWSPKKPHQYSEKNALVV